MRGYNKPELQEASDTLERLALASGEDTIVDTTFDCPKTTRRYEVTISSYAQCRGCKNSYFVSEGGLLDVVIWCKGADGIAGNFQ